MKRIERVRAFVEAWCADPREPEDQIGVDAETLSRELGIQRSDASADLNELHRLGVLCKYGSKPVRFATPKAFGEYETSKTVPGSGGGDKQQASGSAFQGIIGHDGSLRAQIELAKAAVVYPPNGLHTLIIGESGVGKSLLAEAVWRYGVETGALQGPRAGARPPFIVFSCAEYADNPQLLLSQLFGYVKGAFTGAQDEREGLVDRAQGGVLFLDEIHRLPQAGQELLFMLIDRGSYRRLGETREERPANLMIIGATSEDPQSSLLTTFRRRIPVQIALPKLSERPVNERLSLILHFVSQEARRLRVPIWISGQALRIFAFYECTANVGELRSDLQLCCAKSYLSHVSSSADRLIVDIDVVPQRIYAKVKKDAATDPSFIRWTSEGVLVEPGEAPRFHTLFSDYELPIDLYGFVDKKIAEYKFSALASEEIETRVGSDLERYFHTAVRSFHKKETPGIPTSIITPTVWAAAEMLLTTASHRLGRRYGREILVAVALHLQQFTERMKSGRIIYNPQLKQIKANYPDEFQIIQESRVFLNQSLSQEMPEEEMGFLTMFLANPQEEKPKARIGLIVAAHGKSTATSMAEFANSVLGTRHVRAIDAPLDKNLSETITELSHMIAASDEGKGVLVLADMGFFVQMEGDLAQENRTAVKVIPNATTPLVLEAAKKVLTSEDSLEQIVHEIQKAFHDYTDALLVTSEEKSRTHGTILTVCLTGIGSASKMKDLIISHVPMARHMEIIPVSALEDRARLKESYGSDLRLVIGSIDPGIPGVPFLPINEVLSKDGSKRIELLLRGWDYKSNGRPAPAVKPSRQKDVEALAREIHRFCFSLSPEVVSHACEELLAAIEGRLYRAEVPSDLAVRIYLHAASAFDRLATGSPLAMPSWGPKLIRERAKEFRVLHEILTKQCAAMELEIPPAETCHFLVSLPERVDDHTGSAPAGRQGTSIGQLYV